MVETQVAKPKEPLRLTAAEIAAAARKAYDKGRLQAQKLKRLNPDVLCLYSGPCAIGVAMPKAWVKENREYIEGSSLTTLVVRNVLAIEGWNAVHLSLQNLQRTHDKWFADGPKYMEGAFVEALERLEAMVKRAADQSAAGAAPSAPEIRDL